MNVGNYVKNGQAEQLPQLTAKVVGKACSARILAVREVRSKKSQWHGLALDVKVGSGKYSHLATITDNKGNPRFDVAQLAAALKSEETDDWLGQSVRFVTTKGKKGGLFVNVAKPKGK